MSILNCTLNLIYPPISNQEGVWLWEDEEVREYVKKSKIYMLVHRKELKFIDVDEKLIYEGKFKFKISMGEYVSSYFTYKFTDDMSALIEENTSILFEAGDKLFRIKRQCDNKIIYWATPDKIIYDATTKNIVLDSEKAEEIKEFQKFELLYVGISKKNDSFSRLFEKAHDGRLNILSNEFTKEKCARMSDELMILLFEVRWFNVNSMNVESYMGDLSTYTDDEVAIVADAEKAFVSMLESRYNVVKFKEYPKGIDGLYDKGLSGYIYSINYDITIYTDKLSFKGTYGSLWGRDSILIQNDDVSIINNEIIIDLS